MTRKITALIPTYQRPEYLRRAITSVLGQSFANLQVSIFDNSPNDSTEMVVNQLKSKDVRIFYHRHKDNIGSLANFKFAFKSVTTPYFSVLSDDDFIADDFYENAINILESHPEIKFVIFNTLSVDENGNLIGNRNSTNKLNFYCDDNRFDTFLSGEVPTTWTGMVFRKEVAEIYDNMDDRYDISSDMRFLKHAVARYNYAYYSKVGAFFTCHTGSFSQGRKYFDIVQHVVQLSRYVDIYYDANVSPYIKNRAVFYLRKSFLNNQLKPWKPFIQSLKIAVKNICNGIENNVSAINEIQNAANAGHIITSYVLKLMYRNWMIKNIIRKSFSRYYANRMSKHRSEMFALQHGVYKELFNHIQKTFDKI